MLTEIAQILFANAVSVLQEEHCRSVTASSRLTTFWEMIAVYYAKS
jgi:hypothetical protein